MTRKAEYTPFGPYVLIRRELPEVSGLVLPDIDQINDQDAMRFIVEAVGPDCEYKLEIGSEVWLTAGVNAVGTLDDDLFFIRYEQIIGGVERNEVIRLTLDA